MRYLVYYHSGWRNSQLFDSLDDALLFIGTDGASGDSERLGHWWIEAYAPGTLLDTRSGQPSVSPLFTVLKSGGVTRRELGAALQALARDHSR